MLGLVLVSLTFIAFSAVDSTDNEWVADSLSCRSIILTPSEYLTQSSGDDGVSFKWRGYFTSDNLYRILIFRGNELVVVDESDQHSGSGSRDRVRSVLFEPLTQGYYFPPKYSDNGEFAVITSKEPADEYTHFLVNTVTCEVDTLPWSSPECPYPSNNGGMTASHSFPRMGMILGWDPEFCFPWYDIVPFDIETGRTEPIIRLSDVSAFYTSRNRETLVAIFFDGRHYIIEAFNGQGIRQWNQVVDGYERHYLMGSDSFVRRCGSVLSCFSLDSGIVIWEDSTIDYGDVRLEILVMSDDDKSIGIQCAEGIDGLQSGQGIFILIQSEPELRGTILFDYGDEFGNSGRLRLRAVSDTGRTLFEYIPEYDNYLGRRFMLIDTIGEPIWISAADFTTLRVPFPVALSPEGDRFIRQISGDRLTITTVEQINPIE